MNPSRREDDNWKEEISNQNLNDTSATYTPKIAVTALPTGKNLAPFINVYRIHAHWFLYGAYQIVYFIISLPLLVCPTYYWGSLFTEIYRWFFIIRTLGLEFGEYISHWYVTGIVAVLYALLWIVLILSYFIHIRGKVSIFKIVKSAVIGVSFFLSLCYAFTIFSYTTFWDCNTTTGYSNKFPTIRCYQIPNVIWGVVSVYILCSQLIFTWLSTIFVTETSCGTRSSCFAVDRLLFPLYEHSMQLIITVVYHLIQSYNVALWVIPVIQIIHGIVSLILVLTLFPYFNKHINCLSAGISLGRASTSVVSLIASIANFNFIGGTTLGSSAIAVFLAGAIVGFVSSELYILWIMRSVKHAESLLLSSRGSGNMDAQTRKDISIRKLELGLKFALGSKHLLIIQRMDKVCLFLCCLRSSACKTGSTTGNRIMSTFHTSGSCTYLL
jgi:hypothetical protein